MKLKSGWKFVLTVALPLALAGAGTVALTGDLISHVSSGANDADHVRTHEIIQSALKGRLAQLASTVADNANWDDAALRLYADPPDEVWAEGSWASATGYGINYDAMFATATDGTILTGFVRGERRLPDAKVFFGGKLGLVLDRLPRDMATFESTAAIIETPEGVALVGAAPILPTTPDLLALPDSPRFLLLVKFLTPEFIAAIGDSYVVKDLSFLPPDRAEPGALAVEDAAGQKIGALSWTDRLPGDKALGAVMPAATIMLGFLMAVMAGIGILSWRQIEDIAEKERKSRFDASHDSLTGLTNRFALMGEIAAMLESGEDLAVAFVDLDGFKEVNDTYNHETGDRLICAVAAGLAALAENRAKLSRLGGDEFVLLLRGAGCAVAAQTLAADIISLLATPFDLDGRRAKVGASIGIATSQDAAKSPSELMRRADIAMYKAKETGKNRTCLFEARLDAERREDAEIAVELDSIVAAGSIGIAYQPIIAAHDRSIVAVEALARWPKSSPRNLAPDRFIRIAERHGLIDRLGRSILDKALADARNWPEIRVSVNVSPVQLRNPDFVPMTLKALQTAGLPTARLELEITENTLIDDANNAKAQIDDLRKAGISVALDDFGSGYSSIGYLKQFHFDRIKIDRSLVQDVDADTAVQQFVQGVALLANALSAGVTAEGVERQEQVNLLRLAGCSELQGYLFSRPVAAETITAMLAQAQMTVRRNAAAADAGNR